MLLFALFLELLGWFILTGLFTTFCKYTHCFLDLMATHMGRSDVYIAHHSPYIDQEFEGAEVTIEPQC